MESFAAIINFIMELIDLIKRFFNQAGNKDDVQQDNPEIAG